MTLVDLAAICLRNWEVQLTPVPLKTGVAYYRYSILGKNCTKKYTSDQIYPTKQAACQAAYFFCCRAELDHQAEAIMMVERKRGYILALNLPAYELLAVNAVGLSVVDFAADQTTRSWLHQSLQHGQLACQSAQLYNADGHPIHCQLQTTYNPCLPQVSILRIHPPRPVPSHSGQDHDRAAPSCLGRSRSRQFSGADCRAIQSPGGTGH